MKRMLQRSCLALLALCGPLSADPAEDALAAEAALAAEEALMRAAAEARGLPPEAFKCQNEFGDICAKIERKFPDLYIGGEAGGIWKIYLKGEAPDEVRQWVAKSELKIRVMDKQPYSLKELGEMRERAGNILEKAGYTFEGGSLDVPCSISIQVGLKKGLSEDEEDIAALLPKDIAAITSVETIGGMHTDPGMIGYVVAVSPGKDAFLLTSHEPERGRLACNNAIWFGQQNCKLAPGQKVKVWFSGVAQSYPGQSSAIRTELVKGEAAKRAPVIQLALEKRGGLRGPDIPFVVDIAYERPAKQWKVWFASDANEGLNDPEPITVTDQELGQH